MKNYLWTVSVSLLSRIGGGRERERQRETETETERQTETEREFDGLLLHTVVHKNGIEASDSEAFCTLANRHKLNQTRERRERERGER